MATYARVPTDGLVLQPSRCWRKGSRTIELGVLPSGDWYVLRSGWPWAAVFPAVLERDACQFGDRLLRGRGWSEVAVGSSVA